MLRLLQSSAGGTQGFSDKPPGEGGMSRFAPLSGAGQNDFDDSSSFKRPKVADESAKQQESRDRANSASPCGSKKSSESESDDDRKKKKKKKKKKQKKQKREG